MLAFNVSPEDIDAVGGELDAAVRLMAGAACSVQSLDPSRFAVMSAAVMGGSSSRLTGGGRLVTWGRASGFDTQVCTVVVLRRECEVRLSNTSEAGSPAILARRADLLAAGCACTSS